MDSDDWVDLNFVQILVNAIACENADIAFGNFKKVFNDKPDRLYIHGDSNFSTEFFDGKEAFRELFGQNGTSFVIACGKLYKRQLFGNVRFPVGLLHEDEYTTYKLLYSSSKIIFLNIPLYFYFQRENSIMGIAETSSIRALRAKVERFYFIKKSESQNLKELCLKHLCWELLFAYTRDKSDYARTGYSNRKKIFFDFCQCQQEHWKSKAPLIEKLFLKFFSLVPSAYIIYQKLSPVKIRKV